VAVAGLPPLLRGWRRGRDPHAAEERLARKLAAQAAIRAVDQMHETATAELDESASAYATDVTARVMDIYRRRLATLVDETAPREQARHAEALEFQMKLAAMRAERAVLVSLRNTQKINDETLSKLMREVDLSETALITRGRARS
jgi:monovalent cation/hydrogen antiporter